MGSKSKGSRYERELINLFTDAGYFAQRTASSGSATENELPDAIVAKGGNVIVIELKYTADDRVYVDEEKVKGLVWLAHHLDATSRLVARFKHDTNFYAWPIGAVHQTDGGNYRLHRDETDDAEILPVDE